MLDHNVAPVLVGTFEVAIYDHIIAYAFGSPTTLHYITVPMKGDDNQDGKVDITDLVIAASCFGQTVIGSAC